MKKRLLRVVAGVMSLLMVLSCLGGAVPAYAKEEPKATTKAENQEKVLTVTQDMVDKSGKLVITGEWDCIIVPKEINATHISFKEVSTGKVQIESGTKSKIEMVSGEIGVVEVVPAKLTEMSVQELAELIRNLEDSRDAVRRYQELKAQNKEYKNNSPTLITRSSVKVSEVSVSGNVKLNFTGGEVEQVKVDVGESDTVLRVEIANYTGEVAVNQKDREDGGRAVANVLLRNTTVEKLVLEGEQKGNIILNGQNSEVKEAKVESAPAVTINVKTEKLEVGEAAKDTKITVLDKVEEMNIEANNVKIEVGNSGTVANAKVEGDNVNIGGGGTLTDVKIEGAGASVSTSGTKVEGENTYVPPVVVVTPTPSEPTPPTEEPAPSDTEITFLYEEKEDGTLIITGIKTLESAEVAVPAEIGGKRVTEIGDRAFYDNDKIRKVVLPEGLLYIGEFAFGWCRNLTEISMPESITEIADDAFIFTELTSVTLPSKVEKFGVDVFYGCYSLPAIDVAEDNPYFTSIDGVLYSKDKAVLVHAPSGLLAENYEICEGTVVIGDSALSGCYNLVKVVIPASVSQIGWDAFGICENLETIEVAEGNNVFCSIDGALFSKDKTELIRVGEGTKKANYTIPEGVKIISEDAFFRCATPEVITVPSGVTEIGSAAFFACVNLKEIRLPDSVEKIGIQLFTNCEKLTEIEIPSKIKVIPYGTFENCKSLTKITIPSGVEEVDSYAFAGCENLEELVIPFGVMRIEPDAVSDCPKLTMIVGEGSVAELYAIENGIAFAYSNEEVPETTFLYEEKEDGTLRIKGIETLGSAVVNVPAEIDGKSVTEIGSYAFYNNYTIRKVVLPEGLLYIGDSAFNGCSNLTDISMSEGITEIERNAFIHTGLTSVTLPASLMILRSGVFFRCDSLTAIEVAEGNPYFTSVDGVLYNIDKSVLVQVPGGLLAESYEICEGTVVIEDGAFRGCNNLVEVVIPASVSYIGMDVFGVCENLETIEVAEENETYCSIEGVLFSKDKTELIQMGEGTKTTNYTVPDGVIIIGADAFFRCTALETVTIPDGVTDVGSAAFFACDNLKVIQLPDSVEQMGSQVFTNCDMLTEVKLSSKTKVIPYGAFQNCISLTKLTIPSGVEEISEDAFAGCENLEEVVIPASVKAIASNAFAECPILILTVEKGSYAESFGEENIIPVKVVVSEVKADEFIYVETENGTICITGYKMLASNVVEIPSTIEGKTVTAVTGGAFANCTSVTDVTIPDTVTKIGSGVFEACTNLLSVTIPNSVLVIAEDAFKNCSNPEFRIVTTEGTYADLFAKEKGIKVTYE